MTPDELAKIFRFLICGTAAAAVNWFAGLYLVTFMPFSTAILLAYAIGMATGFILYRIYVFKSREGPVVIQVLIFLGVNLVAAAQVWAVTLFLAYTIFPPLGLSAEIGNPLAHLIAIAIGAVLNYIGHSTLTFRIKQSM